jgi:hypothetical protein
MRKNGTGAVILENKDEGLAGFDLWDTETRVYPASAEDGGGFYFETRAKSDGCVMVMSENHFETREEITDWLGQWMCAGAILQRE